MRRQRKCGAIAAKFAGFADLAVKRFANALLTAVFGAMTSPDPVGSFSPGWPQAGAAEPGQGRSLNNDKTRELPVS